ncbi:hypothetical protein DXG01_006220 [Tephrocybe rancida]|nr:hypothetical protein DXG01_006220 [Tephrocybe rancida]
MSPVLADPPGDCCFKGVKHAGTPVGKSIEIAGVPTYISEPTSHIADGPKKIILYLSDVFGPFFLNNQLIQDYFAGHAGYLVLGIDYFFGDGIYLHLDQEGFDREAWIANAREKSREAFPRWLEAVRTTYGTDAKYFTVAAFAHPAWLNEDHFKNITNFTTKDNRTFALGLRSTFPLESRRRAEDILMETKATYHISVFSGVLHGFATRCNLEIENERWAKEEAARQIIGWFTRFSS